MATDQGVGGSNPLAHVWESLENIEFSRGFLLYFPLKHTNCMGKLNIKREGACRFNVRRKCSRCNSIKIINYEVVIKGAYCYNVYGMRLCKRRVAIWRNSSH